MSRPSTIAEVVLRTKVVGTVKVGEFAAQPAMLKLFAGFCEQIEKVGGGVAPGDSTYNRSDVELRLPMSNAELADQLRQEQYDWDALEAVYDICSINGTEPESWRRDDLVKWIAREGVATPWEVVSA